MVKSSRILLVLSVLLLAACNDAPKDKITGTRVPVLTPAAKLAPDDVGQEAALEVPPAEENAEWSQVMGKPDAPLGNLALGQKIEKKWSRSAGAGAGDRARLLSRPVAADGVVYTFDTEANVHAVRLKDGEPLWDRSVAPEDPEETQFGGGLSYADGRLYATTGYGEVLALQAADGKEVWRTNLRDVLRSAPLVYQGRVFVITVTGQLHAINSDDGSVLWTHNGITESSAILGSATPAAAGDVVLVPYNAGELYAVRVQNGRTVWSQSLAGNTQRGTAPSMSDIKASPAVDSQYVYAISHGGRMAAIDIRTGNGVWDADIAGIDTPVLAGNVLYVLADSSTLTAFDRTTGAVLRVQELARFEDDDSTGTSVRWSGPVLAGGVLWLTNSLGQLVGYNAADFKEMYREDIGGSITLAPVVVAGTLLLLTDGGDLVAFR